MNTDEADEQSDDDNWIDAARTAQLVAQFNDWCQHSLKTESQYDGSRQITEFLTEFIALSCIPLRLVRGDTDKVSWKAKQLSLFLAPAPGAGKDGARISSGTAADEPGAPIEPEPVLLQIVTMR